MSGSDYTLTTNLHLFKPNYDADAEQWGNHLNANADTLDSFLGAGGPLVPLTGNVTMTGPLGLAGVSTAPTANPGTSTTQIATTAYVRGELATGPYLPLGGGQMVGNLTLQIPGGPASINLTTPPGNARLLQGNTYSGGVAQPRWQLVLGDNQAESPGNNYGAPFRLSSFEDSGTQRNVITIERPVLTASGQHSVMLTGSLFITGSGYRPGGGMWVDSNSDLRLMNVTGDYTHGLAEVLSLTPVTYQPRDGTASYVGFIGDDVEAIMPEMTSRGPGTVDGATVPDLLTLDLSALPMALVNAIKALHARILWLEERI